MEPYYKYKSINDFRMCNQRLFKLLLERNELKQLCQDMNWRLPETKPNKKPISYWTKEKCMEGAKQYNTLKEFTVNLGGAYYAARKNNWLEEIKQLMNW